MYANEQKRFVNSLIQDLYNEKNKGNIKFFTHCV